MPRAPRKSHAATLAFGALSVEGALIAPAMLARIAEQKAGGQAEADYAVPKGLSLRDEIARYFRIGQALFTDLRASATPTAATTRFVEGRDRRPMRAADRNGPPPSGIRSSNSVPRRSRLRSVPGGTRP